jgi:hypothetical protein
LRSGAPERGVAQPMHRKHDEEVPAMSDMDARISDALLLVLKEALRTGRSCRVADRMSVDPATLRHAA